MTILVSKDAQFPSASFDVFKNFVQRYTPTDSPTQQLKHGFSALKFNEYAIILVSFEMISKILQAELLRLKMDSLG